MYGNGYLREPFVTPISKNANHVHSRCGISSSFSSFLCCSKSSVLSWLGISYTFLKFYLLFLDMVFGFQKSREDCHVLCFCVSLWKERNWRLLDNHMTGYSRETDLIRYQVSHWNIVGKQFEGVSVSCLKRKLVGVIDDPHHAKASTQMESVSSLYVYI